jgi:hypothetical protein
MRQLSESPEVPVAEVVGEDSPTSTWQVIEVPTAVTGIQGVAQVVTTSTALERNLVLEVVKLLEQRMRQPEVLALSMALQGARSQPHLKMQVVAQGIPLAKAALVAVIDLRALPVELMVVVRERRRVSVAVAADTVQRVRAKPALPMADSNMATRV